MKSELVVTFWFDRTNDVLISIRERPLMMSDFRGGGRSKMIQKNQTLKGKNRTLGGGQK